MILDRTPYDGADLPEGPWKDEPVSADFEAFGLRCALRRSKASGCWNGYVVAPIEWVRRHSVVGQWGLGVDVEVHGGLTYQAEVGELYILGFDTAHSGDLLPKFPAVWHIGVYRTFEYTKAQTISLAEQVAAWGEKPKIRHIRRTR